MDARIRDKVRLELGQVDVESTIEPEEVKDLIEKKTPTIFKTPVQLSVKSYTYDALLGLVGMREQRSSKFLSIGTNSARIWSFESAQMGCFSSGSYASSL